MRVNSVSLILSLPADLIDTKVVGHGRRCFLAISSTDASFPYHMGIKRGLWGDNAMLPEPFTAGGDEQQTVIPHFFKIDSQHSRPSHLST